MVENKAELTTCAYHCAKFHGLQFTFCVILTVYAGKFSPADKNQGFLMPGEFDPRLMNVLQGAMGLSDSLRDLGVAGEINIALNRSDGLLLLHLVTGASDAPAEEFSQRGRPLKAGMNSLRLAGVTFEWPQATVLNGALPGAPAAPANDNARDALLLSFGFEEETPALR